MALYKMSKNFSAKQKPSVPWDARAFGLCADCLNAQRVESTKGSVFLLCGLSRSNTAFPRYPRLPVLSCRGYNPTKQDAKNSEGL